MKVFISYHRADTEALEQIESLLDNNCIPYYCIPKTANFDGKHHQYIKDTILKEMLDCDVIICIIGKNTYKRPHVDWELHQALKGDIYTRKGILAVMLENRGDCKNNIMYETFPNRLKDNIDYIVIEQYASLYSRLVYALNEALDKSRNSNIKIINKRKLMQLRNGKYYDIN